MQNPVRRARPFAHAAPQRILNQALREEAVEEGVRYWRRIFSYCLQLLVPITCFTRYQTTLRYLLVIVVHGW